MKRIAGIVWIGFFGVACNSNSTTQIKLDSISKKFDSSAGKLWDSTKEKAKDLKQKIENRLEQKDSARNKADTTYKL